MRVFPVTIATGIVQRGIMLVNLSMRGRDDGGKAYAGKLNGAILERSVRY
jgi:hypothetical protein